LYFYCILTIFKIKKITKNQIFFLEINFQSDIMNNMINIKLSDFKYKLPKTLVAKYPLDPRNSSRMLVVNHITGEMQDKKFADIMSIIQKGDCIVLNETKVFPARIYGTKEKTNAKIEMLLLRELKVAEENL
jgi:S-adenosylmethionine:tRNA-ribosyltransferase-isomerase (queuine synthetase)